MKTTAQLFNECLVSVPNDIKLELDMSFAIADKIDMVFREKISPKNSLQKKWAKQRQKSLDGLMALIISL